MDGKSGLISSIGPKYLIRTRNKVFSKTWHEINYFKQGKKYFRHEIRFGRFRKRVSTISFCDFAMSTDEPLKAIHHWVWIWGDTKFGVYRDGPNVPD